MVVLTRCRPSSEESMEAFEDMPGGVGMVDPVVDDGDGRVIVRPVATKGEAKKARRLLVQEIADMGRATFPKDWINADDLFGPTPVGAFLDDRLVGAALVGPTQEYSAALAATCRGVWPSRLLDHALQLAGIEIAETPCGSSVRCGFPSRVLGVRTGRPCRWPRGPGPRRRGRVGGSACLPCP